MNRTTGWDGARKRRKTLAAVGIALGALTLLSGLGGTAAAGSGASGLVAAGTSSPLMTLYDGGQLVKSLLAGGTSILSDHLTYAGPSANGRTYTVHVTTRHPIATLFVTLSTAPLSDWALPKQLPGGPDNLPPLSDWKWTVFKGTARDSSAWTMHSGLETITRTVAWVNASYTIVGTVFPTPTVTVNPTVNDGTHATGVGVVLVDRSYPQEYPAGDSDYGALATPLHLNLLRISTTSPGLATAWDASTHNYRYNWTAFDGQVGFAASVHAPTMVTLPAGNWGDGNIFPTGTPMNTALRVPWGSWSGYYPTQSAYTTYLKGILHHTVVQHQAVRYWSIGNEVPLATTTQVAGFVSLFNLAQRTIHATYPKAQVGSDVMTNPSWISYFAHHTYGVGFLSFHYYPAIGLCFLNGNYCPPAGKGKGSTDPALFAHPAFTLSGHALPPAQARATWASITGHTLPIFSTETNLNGAGGPPKAHDSGTDPRQQTLFGAAYWISALIEGAKQQLGSVLYFTLSGPPNIPTTTTGPYGGWGFGLTREGSADNNIKFAPWWAFSLYGGAIPAGAAGLKTSVTNSADVWAYAVKSGTGVNVVVVNRVAVQSAVAVTTTVTTQTARSASVLDSKSYQEVWVPSAGREELRVSGVRAESVSGATAHLQIDGYGVAVVHFQAVPRPLSGPAPSSNIPPLPSGGPDGASAYVGPVPSSILPGATVVLSGDHFAPAVARRPS